MGAPEAVHKENTYYSKLELPDYNAKPIPPKNLQMIKTAENEIDRLKDMNHPRIIGYYGFKKEESTIVIFMEYMAAGSLLQIIKDFGPIKEPASIKYIEQILDGLAYIHKIGIIHCDLKCDNILNDGQGNVKLGDFGIAMQKRINTANHSYFSQEVKGGGTCHWLAPEVMNGEGCSRRSDIWSLGCTIVEMLTGKPPYSKMAPNMFNGAIFLAGPTQSMKEEVYVIAKFDYTAKEENELSIKKNERFKLIDGSNNRWQVTNEHNQSGYVLSNFLRKESLLDKAKGALKGVRKHDVGHTKPKLPDSNAQPSSSKNSPNSSPFSSTVVHPVVIALFDFEASIANELSFQKDERLEIIDRPLDDPYWWKARNAKGCVGLIPITYIKAPESPALSESFSSGIASGFNSHTDSFASQPSSEATDLIIEQSTALLNLGDTKGEILARESESKDYGDASRAFPLRKKYPTSVLNSHTLSTNKPPAQTQREIKKWTPTNYVKKEKLGQGAFGVVYKCFDTDAQKFFVAKETILPTTDVINIAKNEINRLKDINHPRIIGYYGFKMEESTIVIYMEYMAAGSLLQIIKDFGPIKEPASIKYIEQILDGLAYIHKIGIVHCDLKCDNILSDGQGNVKLGDFGIAVQKLINTANHSYFSQNEKRGGTYHWMAPEVMNGEGCGRKSDIWSLGCTIVEMLTGDPPHGKMPSPMFMGAIYTKSLSYKPDELIPKFSDKMKAFLSQLLQLEIDKRPYSAFEAIKIFDKTFQTYESPVVRFLR
uniref:Mitogen-activated protein kinase kinase kinase n=1 Tax=Plectus sambesii TaxID=2011161 RepID=A0A914WF44_9BILA